MEKHRDLPGRIAFIPMTLRHDAESILPRPLPGSGANPDVAGRFRHRTRSRGGVLSLIIPAEVDLMPRIAAAGPARVAASRKA
jgi:hypothetical protein